MLEVILVRHGLTDWNLGRRIMGARPIPLNEAGVAQLKLLQEMFGTIPLDAIFTSPIKRAVQSAQLLKGTRDIPIIESEDLREIDYGPWVGKTFDEISATPEFRDYFLRPHLAQVPDGESLAGVTARACDFIERLKKQGKRQRIVAISHADVIKAILVKYLGLPLNEFHRLRIDNASYSVLWSNLKVDRVLVINALPELKGFFEKNTIFSSEDLK